MPSDQLAVEAARAWVKGNLSTQALMGAQDVLRSTLHYVQLESFLAGAAWATAQAKEATAGILRQRERSLEGE